MELHRPEPLAVRGEASTRLARLLLRRRALTTLHDEAYRLFHGIPWAESDSLDAESVVNLAEAGGEPGQTVPRESRVSIVFVYKPDHT